MESESDLNAVLQMPELHLVALEGNRPSRKVVVLDAVIENL
jgi:hypothetical protein